MTRAVVEGVTTRVVYRIWMAGGRRLGRFDMRRIWSAAAFLMSLTLATCEAAVEHAEPSTPAHGWDERSASPEPREQTGFVVAAVGDIACDPTSPAFGGHDSGQCQHRATAALVGSADAVFALGDLQYESGSLSGYLAGYDRSWGRFAQITYPSPGNHEHETPGAEGYFDYWRSKERPTGRARSGAYSFDLGAWHIISLDSSCPPSCGEGSPQDAFLERDLAGSKSRCILAFWHHPYFNSGAVHGEESLANVRVFWDDLFAAGADVVVNGHEHNYQRYAEQDPSGRATTSGIRQFVVGTGGRSHYGMLDRKDPNYEAGDSTHFGVLRLFLHDSSYSWEFVGVGGKVLDRGGATGCD
jgi:hypothetical protein